MEILRKLVEDRKNNVWLLSALPRAALSKMTALLPNIGLVYVSFSQNLLAVLFKKSRAENGCYIKPRAIRGREQDWINMIVNYNMTWKTPCLEILSYVSNNHLVVVVL